METSSLHPLSTAARDALHAWFQKQATALPWRRQRNPYRVWVAEIMLTQTRVATVLRYYERFLDTFPTIQDLARAPAESVIKRWEGLGYYARVRNLQKAAKIIMQRYGGELPRSEEALSALPGIGKYTAAAIASIAFGSPVAAVDGNVRRVLSRLLDIAGDVHQGQGARLLERAAQDWLPYDAPGRHNEALMELGQRICRPRKTRCPECPLRAHCRAHLRGTVSLRPQPRRRSALRREWHLGAIIFDDAGRLLLRQRATDETLGNLWTFPGGRIRLRAEDPQNDSPAAGATLLAAFLREQLGCAAQVGELYSVIPLHISGLRAQLFVYRAKLTPSFRLPNTTFRWLTVEERAKLSFAKAERHILARLTALL